ncbi:MAG: hypothetical protein WAV32_04790 [Halobacteriota archaeon]
MEMRKGSKKPRFKMSEMHGDVPAALQHGTVVSASAPRRGAL